VAPNENNGESVPPRQRQPVRLKSMPRRILIIAGPNGAGKTTFAREFLPREGKCPNFVNADLIAAGLSPFNPEAAAVQAGRLMLQEIRRHVAARNTFAFETTLSGRAYARMIPKWRSIGYRVELYFIKLAVSQIAEARVKARVRQGGHNIPRDVIRRRFAAGWKNFQSLYRPLVDHWELYDNSGDSPILLERKDRS
jgi:predicted ABC-type ATPase